MAISAPEQTPAPPRPPARPQLPWLLIALVAILGGAAALGIALVSGAVPTATQTTTVVQTGPTDGLVASASTIWAAVYRQAVPGQVSITARSTATVPTPLGPRQQQETDTGSGFVLNGQGDLVTAAHVVNGASSISVSFAGGGTRDASLLGKDNATDVAVLHIDPVGLTLHPLALGNSAALAVGDPLAVLGDPLGFNHSISTGVVSALDRTIVAPNGFQIAHAIQTDAAMNPGNSGGPLLDTKGHVIGIADQIATGNNQYGTGTTTSTGIGFAVPIGLIAAELTALEHGQTVTHPYLGISTTQTSTGAAGVEVAGVRSNGPAARAGLRTGDVIVAWNGQALIGESALIDALATARPGQRVTLTIQRGNTRQDITLTLGTQPKQASGQ